jgi:hypothetical protein
MGGSRPGEATRDKIGSNLCWLQLLSLLAVSIVVIVAAILSQASSCLTEVTFSDNAFVLKKDPKVLSGWPRISKDDFHLLDYKQPAGLV